MKYAKVIKVFIIPLSSLLFLPLPYGPLLMRHLYFNILHILLNEARVLALWALR